MTVTGGASSRSRVPRLLVVLFTGHVGSSWLTSMLASHSQIQQLGFEPVDELTALGLDATPYFERLFLSGSIDGFPPEVRTVFSKTTEAAKDALPGDTPDLAADGVKFVAFKARLNLRIQRRFFLEWLPGQNPFLVLIRRRNKLKNAVSQFKRTQLQISHLNQFERNEAKRRPVRVDCDYIVRQATQFTLRELRCKTYFDRMCTSRGFSGLELHYEDLLRGSGDVPAIDSLIETLELSSEDLGSQYRKMTADDLKDAVINYDELARRVLATPFAPSLSDDTFDIVERLSTGLESWGSVDADGELAELRRI